MVFDLHGTPAQNAIIGEAIARCDFPWQRLADGLNEIGKTVIPVRWEDLTRFAPDKEGHAHVAEHGFEGHVIADARHGALGLWWLTPRCEIWIEASLEADPYLAQDVFLSEAAHAVDELTLTPEQRTELFRVYHQNGMTNDEADAHYGEHGFFEETGDHNYWAWVGESFMAGFVYAFSDLEPFSAQYFEHKSTPEMGEEIRAIVLGEEAGEHDHDHDHDEPVNPPVEEPVTPPVPEPVVPEPATPEPEPLPEPPVPEARFYASANGKTFHDSHRGINAARWFATAIEAEAAGLRACGTCDPLK